MILNYIGSLAIGYSSFRSISKAIFLSVSLSLATAANAEINWISVTLDNDLFVNSDNGYTNGLYVSLYDTGTIPNELPSHDFWVEPLMWSMQKDNIKGVINAYTIGQTMNTPSDINIIDPDEKELPYSALLSLTNSYMAVTPNYADRVSTTIGIVGPAAFGEQAQKFVHSIIGADEPQGWDTQLENELLFQFSRARTWRTWASKSDHYDLLTSADFSLGTIKSSVDTGVTIRYGRDLINSYATTLLNSSRISNPVTVDDGWFVYAGVKAGYVFNQIFTDGNTFHDSRSINYDHEFVGLTAGFAYAWEGFSLTFAVNDANIIQTGRSAKTLKNLTQYGTLTLAWRM